MTFSGKILGLAGAAALAAGLTAPVLAQSTTAPSPPAGNPAMNCSNTATTNTSAASGTTGTTTATGTAVNSTTPNTSAPPVSPNTPANTNNNPINSNNPGAHATAQNGAPCATNPAPATNTAKPPSSTTMPPPPAAPAAPMQSQGMTNGPGGTTMNALSDNPNGSQWLAKFDRPAIKHHKTKKHLKHPGGSIH